ncbi:MAG: GNAT family N-acetyltransferase [Methylocella sp.]
MSQSVRECADADKARVSAMLGAAFQDDPVIAYIFPNPEVRRARLPGFYGVVYGVDGARGARFMTANGEAATIWRAPGHERHSLVEKIQQAWPWVAASGPAIGRVLVFSGASDEHHPPEPHWYLHAAGCLPSAQRKGFGSAAVRAGLARADADGVPAYLETATEANLPFYASLGFAVTHEWKVKNGPRCWSMLRKPS